MNLIEYQEKLAEEFGNRIRRFHERCQTYLDGLLPPADDDDEDDDDEA